MTEPEPEPELIHQFELETEYNVVAALPSWDFRGILRLLFALGDRGTHLFGIFHSNFSWLI
jgi:hypothetical protein